MPHKEHHNTGSSNTAAEKNTHQCGTLRRRGTTHKAAVGMAAAGGKHHYQHGWWEMAALDRSRPWHLLLRSTDPGSWGAPTLGCSSGAPTLAPEEHLP